jgi:hypothetical protein
MQANKTKLQYRITVNESTAIHNEYPQSYWSRIAEVAESRGGIDAKLERRSVTSQQGLSISPWEVIAEVKG